MRFRGLLLILAAFMSGCSSLFYHPTREELVYRDKLPLKPRDIHFQSKDGTKLHAWHFPALGTKNPKAAIVLFHGNAENLSSHFIQLYEAPARGYAYLIFDYRGYGKSEGSPKPKGTVEDGVAAIRWMHSNYPNTPLVIFGQSLGGAVAFKAVNQIKDEIKISLIVADSTFHDYRSAARSLFARNWLLFLFQPLAWALADNSASPKDDIPELSPIPLLIVHGTKDPVVDYSLGQEVYALAKDPKEFWSIPEGRHIDFMLRESGKYGDKLFERLDQMFDSSRK